MKSATRTLTGLAAIATAAVLCVPNATLAQGVASVSETEQRIRRLSEAELKDFYLGCSEAALRQLLGSGEIAVCSVAYELLLDRHFGGDFDAFLAWSRSQDQNAVATALKRKASQPSR